MSTTNKTESAATKTPAAGAKTPDKASSPAVVEKLPPLFRPIDWLALLLAFGAVWITYLRTLAPELTLEDSGELCTGSFYAGIPHPPGYPFWAIYSHVWTRILPFGNVAWRVEVGESFAAAFGCGLVAMMVSRGSSMLMEGIEELKSLRGTWETAICVICGAAAGIMLGLGDTMWVESVAINRISLFGMPWMMLVTTFMMRWMYAPYQRRYLYLGMFIFGLCATIHQTLLVAALAVEVGVVMTQPRLGRTFLLGNSLIWIGAQAAMAAKLMSPIDTAMLMAIFNAVGVVSILGFALLCVVEEYVVMDIAVDASLAVTILAYPVCAWLQWSGGFGEFLVFAGFCSMVVFGVLNWKRGNEWLVSIICGILWGGGASFYLYEAISGMTNPPMEWGYPRTREGFYHALSRGQYEKANPTDLFTADGWERFGHQLGFLAHGIANEFNWLLLIVAIVPIAFMFFVKMQKRERAWLSMLTATYFCVGIILVILMNPSEEKQSVDLHQVFFTTSHGIVAILFGYGLALAAAFMATNYKAFRTWGLFGGGLAVVLAIYTLYENVGRYYAGIDGAVSIGELPQWVMKIFNPGQYSMPIIGTLILIGLSVAFLIGMLAHRDKAPLALTLGAIALMPLYSGLAHWGTSEQRDHWFGYWFGHEMFTPSFNIFPPMSKDAVLFGGTDPGRFCPTYMIFCESFIPHKDQPKEDQNFDRRDVYIITQNALADPTYLDYIRAQYNRSKQIDPPFFQEMARGDKEREENYETNGLAKWLYKHLDVPLTAFGARVEARRRAEGVYPPKEIYIPSPEDSDRCFKEYMTDANQRYQHDQIMTNEPPQMRPGEDYHQVMTPQGPRYSVSGQAAVMSINGLLTKVIFDNCPSNDFYVEESFPLDWMYPYESPYGIIMKINRQPLEELTPKMVDDDHKFWSKFSERLIGDWITYDTSVSNICQWIQKVHLEKNFNGFKGNQKFIRDEMAQKAFSKLRSSQAGVYAWRFHHAKTVEEQQRMLKEADFAFRQSFAYCPYSPEVVFNYVTILTQIGRMDDALLIADTCHKMDPNNGSITQMRRQVENMRDQMRLGGGPQARSQQPTIEDLEKAYHANTDNFQAGFTLAGGYYQAGQPDKANALMDEMINNPKADKNVIASAINYYIQTKAGNKLEGAFARLVQVSPHEPQAWVELANLQLQSGKSNQAEKSFAQAMIEDQLILKATPGAEDKFKKRVMEDARLKNLRELPGVQKLLGPG